MGVVDGVLLLDLNYDEDSRAQVDMNLVQTGGVQLVEVQGTAERNPFGKEVFYQLLDLASHGVRQLVEVQKSVIRL